MSHMIKRNLLPEQSELGKKSLYDTHYNPELLFPIARKLNREAIGILTEHLPFYGFDQWNHYEVSWLNTKGKPIVALAEIIYGCDSQYIIESKSMKLYFNSLNNTRFENLSEVQALVKKDLQECIGTAVLVNIIPIDKFTDNKLTPRFSGICLDDLDIECSVYTPDASFLTVTEGLGLVTETVYSDLLKSNCLVTHQPDWGSVQITYKGNKINQEGLLHYLISFRNHNEFHEQCIERIFMDIMRKCEPIELTVYGRYTRRGGLEINPYRTTRNIDGFIKNERLCRQ